MNKLVSLFFLFFISCHNRDTSTVAELKTIQVDSVINTKDSLRDTIGYYYLTDLPLRKVAIMILEDSLIPSDNKVTFDCLDSITNNKLATRDFYFPVFLKISDSADGAVAEVVGSYTTKYIEKFPKEFSNRYLNMSSQQINKWVGFTGYEVYYDHDDVKGAKEWGDSVVGNCSDCNLAQLAILKRFNDSVIAVVKEDAANK